MDHIKMDFTSTNTFFLILTLAAIVKIISMIYHRFYPEFFTRIKIRKVINSSLYDKHYQLVENVDIICSDGHQLFIKQLLVSRYGIFIIDTYHYRGIIYGSDHQVKCSIWDRITGRHSKIQDENSLDAYEATQRDQREKDTLIYHQIKERQTLQGRQDTLNHTRSKEMEEMKQAIFSKLPEEKIQSLEQRIIHEQERSDPQSPSLTMEM